MTVSHREDRRSLRILFSLLHPGYLRHYGEPIRILAERGHTVRIVLSQPEKDPGDARLVQALTTSWPSISYGPAPARRYVDGWRRVAWMVRGLMDLARYGDPRYDDASALKQRMRKKITLRVATSRMDPLSKRATIRFVNGLATAGDAERARAHVGWFARLESAIPTSRRITRYVRHFGPDVVIASPVVEIASPQVELLKSAQRIGIPTCVCIASWDNLTNKGLIRVQPDRVIVWNDQQRQELEDFHGISPERVVLTGAQKFDKWFACSPSSTREAFCARIGLESTEPYVLYLCSSPFIAPDEVSFVRRWLAMLRGDQRLRDVPVVIRPHPQNATQWNGVDLHDLGEAIVFPRGGAQPDADRAMTDFYDSLARSAAVVGVNTSALIEAGIVGKRVYTVLAPEFSGTQEGTLHFHYLLEENGGFVYVADSLEEHLTQLAGGLRNAAAPAETARTRAFIERFCRPHGLNVPAAPLVAEAIEGTALLDVPRVRPGFQALVLRTLLYPIPAAVGGSAAILTGWRWVRSTIDEKLLGRPPQERRSVFVDEV